MEIILSGSEKELSKFIKSSRLHFKRKGISIIKKGIKPIQKRQPRKPKTEENNID